jgi:quercetin dioxygenase-like cupin family protein
MDPQERLRLHPADRFAGECHLLDLYSLLTELRSEEHISQNGHRQVTIFRRPPVTYVLFAFEAAGNLADHAARGVVTIQCLEGALLVEAGGEKYQLVQGGMVVLKPEVRHSVYAETAAAMLLSVVMEEEK